MIFNKFMILQNKTQNDKNFLGDSMNFILKNWKKKDENLFIKLISFDPFQFLLINNDKMMNDWNLH